MATSSKQDNDFLIDVMGTGLLENSIEWIKNNINPEEVYGERYLLDWASNYDPDGIFSKDTLESWAESNGYVKE